jgi:hypothetical protein
MTMQHSQPGLPASRARGLKRGALLALIAIGALFWLSLRDRRRGHRAGTLRELVDVASEDSFPASDPPVWTTGRDPGAPLVLSD